MERVSTLWMRAKSGRFDKRALVLADKHYSRQKPGTPQFVKPGKCIVLLTPDLDALWVSSWQQYSRSALVLGSWECSYFRNESRTLSSTLIREAVAATAGIWGEPPPKGFLTMVDASKTTERRSRTALPGQTFIHAGWKLLDARTGVYEHNVLHLSADAIREGGSCAVVTG